MVRRIAYAVLVCFLVTSSALAQDAVDFAAKLIGRPYVWGAEGPNAFDCSGLTQYVYQEFGIHLPRRAIDQARSGEPAGSRLQRGDLLFFSTDTRQSVVTHVGLYEGNGTTIQASKRYGRVRSDSLNSAYWRDRFMFARRIGADRDGPLDAGSDERHEPRRRPSDRKRAALRIFDRIAGELFKIPGR